jgi:hypothetical protein
MLALTIALLVLMVLMVLCLVKRSVVPWTWTVFLVISTVMAGVALAVIFYAPQLAVFNWKIIAIVWLVAAIAVFLIGSTTRMLVAIAIIVMVAMVGSIAWVIHTDLPKGTVPTGQGQDFKKDTRQVAEDITVKALEAQGGIKDVTFVTQKNGESGKIDVSKDMSVTGDNAFSKEKIQSQSQMVALLKSDSPETNTLMGDTINTTGGTSTEALNPDNWVLIQCLSDGMSYSGNTYFLNGEKVVDSNSKAIGYGDIFLAFVSPSTGKFIFVRGACANPQVTVPVTVNKIIEKEKIVEVPTIVTNTIEVEKIIKIPVIKTVTRIIEKEKKEIVEEKDPTLDPSKQGNAPVGGGKNQDSGTGNSPSGTVTQPSATPLTTPAAPVAQTVTVDSTPAPAAESTAPTPAAPATGYSAPPGM